MLQPFDQPSPDTARTLRTKLTKASGWKCEKKDILCRQNMKSWKIYNFTTFEWNMGSWPLASMLMFDSACLGLVLILQIPALPIALATFAALALAHPFPVPTCITAIISPEKKRIRGCCFYSRHLWLHYGTLRRFQIWVCHVDPHSRRSGCSHHSCRSLAVVDQWTRESRRSYAALSQSV